MNNNQPVAEILCWRLGTRLCRLFPCLYAPFVRLYIVDQTGVQCYETVKQCRRQMTVANSPVQLFIFGIFEHKWGTQKHIDDLKKNTHGAYQYKRKLNL